MKGHARSKAVQDEWSRIMPRRVTFGGPTRSEGEPEQQRRMAMDGGDTDGNVESNSGRPSVRAAVNSEDGGDADGNVETDSGRPNVRAAVNNAGPVMAQASDDDAVHADRNSVT